MPVLKLINPPGKGPIFRFDAGAGAGAARDFILMQKAGSEVFSVDVNGLPDPPGGDAKRVAFCLYGDVAADSDALVPFIWKAKKAVVLTAIKICVDTVTADGTTNKQTLTFKRSSDNATIKAYTTPAENPGLAQATWTDISTLSNTSIAADERVYLTFTKVSSGLALSGLAIQIEYTLAA